MAGMAGNGWKWLEMAKKKLKIAGMAGHDLKYLEIAGKC